MNKTIIGLMVGLAMLFIIVGCTQDTSVGVPHDTLVSPITNFNECVAAGNLVMESYPEQCRANGQTFTKEYPAENPDECLASNPSRPTRCVIQDQVVNETSVPSEKMRVMPSNEPLPPAVEAGKAFVESEANSSAIVLSAHEVIWPDGCMGIIDPAATCLAEPLKGYNLTIYAGESEYEIHTDENGTVVRKASVKHTGALAI